MPTPSRTWAAGSPPSSDGSAWTCFCPGPPATRCRCRRTSPTRSSNPSTPLTPNIKRCSPNRWVWRCWSSSTSSVPPNDWRSSCTTCSASRSSGSASCSTARRTPPSNSPAGARARIRRADNEPEPDLGRQQKVVSAFLAASRGGDFDALLAALDPDVVLRVDAGANLAGPGVSKLVHGATAVAAQAARFSGLAPFARLVLVNGSPGIVNAPKGRPVAVMAFTVASGRIVEIDILADPDRLAGLDLPPLEG